MGKIMIINGSPRAPRSNSRQYAKLFSDCCSAGTDYCAISDLNHLPICHSMENYLNVLIVFPLYADSIPVTLLNFLKTLEKNPPAKKPVISIIINCGFIEPYQNNIAVDIIRLYCRNNHFPFGSVLKIGSGEAILSTPFQIILKRKMKKLADSIITGKYKTLHVTMPVPKTLFIKASSVYWKKYGKKNGITGDEMSTMKIEQQNLPS